MTDHARPGGHDDKRRKINMAYRMVYLRIRSNGYNVGWTSDTGQTAFKEESRRIFQELGCWSLAVFHFSWTGASLLDRHTRCRNTASERCTMQGVRSWKGPSFRSSGQRQSRNLRRSRRRRVVPRRGDGPGRETVGTAARMPQ